MSEPIIVKFKNGQYGVRNNCGTEAYPCYEFFDVNGVPWVNRKIVTKDCQYYTKAKAQDVLNFLEDVGEPV